MAKKSQDGKSKRPATPHGAGYLFYHSGNCGGLTDFSTLDVPKVLGYGGLALGGVLLNVLLHCIRGAVAHCGLWDSVSMQNQLCFPHYKAPTGLPFEDGQR